ncbi:MAG: UDP-N-acetylmuramate dehydrogenase [Patescibacteria group bacterium]
MFQSNISLSQYSNYKIGGAARYFYQSDKIGDLIKAVKQARKDKAPVFILGGGTNILFNDDGFSGLVLKPLMRDIKKNGDEITVGAGASMANLLELAVDKGLGGLEWAGGLPGLIGGAIRGNAGAFGGEIKDSIKEVVSLDISKPVPQIIKRNNQQCRFGYRDSIFKSGPTAGKEIILEATFQLRSGDKKLIRQTMEDKINWRRARQPLEYPNIGSIFKNINWELVPEQWKQDEKFKQNYKTDPFPVIPAAFLIDQCRLKGVTCGGAMISPKHPNFIVNVLNASAGDVKQLINLVKNAVFDRFGIKMEEEVLFL